MRSIEDSGEILLKPISILVGRNSSGKSTLARVFPLLRQSSEATKKGPILWWGKLVDFGSFEHAVNRYATEKKIGLSFKISFDEDDLRVPTRRGLGRLSVTRLIQPGTLNLELQFSNGESGSYTSSISISVFDFKAKLSLDEEGYVSEIESGTYTWKETNQLICYGPQDRLIPNVGFFRQSSNSNETTWESFDPFGLELERIIKNFVHGNTALDRIRQLANKIPLGSRSEIFRHLLQISNPPSFRDMLQQLGKDSITFKRLCDVYFASQIDVLLYRANNVLNNFMGDVIYLEPVRATAQRYYRQQSLAVGEIDSKGENIAMFLDGLSKPQQHDFSQWTSRNFGIEVAPIKAGGHISLTIKQAAGGAEVNIADMGFGFSQMLPIAAQLWKASSTKTNGIINRYISHKRLIVIEQPELHLHPEYQSKLADVFVGAIREENNANPTSENSGIRIIAETHSPALINRLGALIADNVVNRESIQVILFDQGDSQSPTKVSVSEFDDEGILQNWPIGFFDPN